MTQEGQGHRLEETLNKIGLGTLTQRFKDEKIDFETIIAATDNELTRLGVVTIGDKVRLIERFANKKQS